MKEKQEKAALWKVCGVAALLWAVLAAGFSVLFPGSAGEAPADAAGILRSCLLLPLIEEIIFRGAVLRLLEPLGDHAALLLQAVLFAALHGSGIAKLYALGMGMIFGWAAQKAAAFCPGWGCIC